MLDARGPDLKTAGQMTLKFGPPAKPSAKFVALFKEKLHFCFQDCVLPPHLLSRNSFRDLLHVLAPTLELPGRNLFAKERKDMYRLRVQQVRRLLC